jgi:hypothetical protein
MPKMSTFSRFKNENVPLLHALLYCNTSNAGQAFSGPDVAQSIQFAEVKIDYPELPTLHSSTADSPHHEKKRKHPQKKSKNFRPKSEMSLSPDTETAVAEISVVLLQEVQVVRVDVELVEVAAVALVTVVELLNAAEVVDAPGHG